MLGDFVVRCFLLVFGYTYPAFQCFKMVEKNRVDIAELRFWCQYWIIMAMVTVLERITDILISWFPMYSELKLAFVIYLWHPKTKGTAYVYDTVLRPFIAQHENDIDRKLKECRARAWDLTVFYWQNCAVLGQAAFFQLLQFLASQTGKFSDNSKKDSSNQRSSSSPSSFINRVMLETLKPNTVRVDKTDGQPDYVNIEEETTPASEPGSKHMSPVAAAAAAGDSQSDEKMDSPQLRLRRSKPDC